jgi:hypothetical protein
VCESGCFIEGNFTPVLLRNFKNQIIYQKFGISDSSGIQPEGRLRGRETSGKQTSFRITDSSALFAESVHFRAFPRFLGFNGRLAIDPK